MIIKLKNTFGFNGPCIALAALILATTGFANELDPGALMVPELEVEPLQIPDLTLPSLEPTLDPTPVSQPTIAPQDLPTAAPSVSPSPGVHSESGTHIIVPIQIRPTDPIAACVYDYRQFGDSSALLACQSYEYCTKADRFARISCFEKTFTAEKLRLGTDYFKMVCLEKCTKARKFPSEEPENCPTRCQ